MKISILIIVAISFLFVFSGLVSIRPVASTTASQSYDPVIQGHSPVDLFVSIYYGNTLVGSIGCASEPCSIVNTLNDVKLNGADFSAIFSGPTGTGCETESGPETISINVVNAPVGFTYTLALKLLPSDSYFATSGPGCLTSTTSTTTQTTTSSQSCPTIGASSGYPYTITITDTNTLTMTGNVQGPGNCVIYSGQGNVGSNGVVSGFSGFSSGVPEFPVSMALAVAIAFMLFAILRGFSSSRFGRLIRNPL